MNRRRFLKYAGATAAVIGASALGVNYVAQQSASIESPTSSTTVTRQVATTTSPFTMSTQTVELTSLRGRLFFDYNGNGIQDGEEPAVAGALVQLKDDTGRVIAGTLTDSSGDYQLEDVKSGSYRLHIGVEHFSDKRFRYMCTSTDEFRAVADGYDLSLAADSTKNIGLMEGFLTSPLRRGTSFHHNAYFDDDPSSGIRDWKGGGNTVNNHEGTDFGVHIGTPVFSAAPGIVKYIDDWGSIGLFVIVSHDPHATNMSTLYAHLSKSDVKEGQRIQRGAKLGESGEDKTHPGPHLHFELDFGFHGSPTRGSPYQPVDPFRALWKADAIGYWTRDNDPQYSL